MEQILIQLLINFGVQAANDLLPVILAMVQDLADDGSLNNKERQWALRQQIKGFLPDLSSSMINAIAELAVVAVKKVPGEPIGV